MKEKINMANKNNYFTSPKGVAQYAWLNTPDTAFNQNAYKVALRMNKEDAKEFLDELQTVANDNLGSKAADAHMPYKTDAETGEILLTFKSKFKPKFCSADGAIVSEEPSVGSGSCVKIKGSFYPYENSGVGISLQMSHVQVIDLVEHGGGQQFEPEEGSFKPTAGGDANNYNF
jgi:hypothetical protein